MTILEELRLKKVQTKGFCPPVLDLLGGDMIRLPNIIFLPSPKLAVGAHAPAIRGRVDQCVGEEVTQIRLRSGDHL